MVLNIWKTKLDKNMYNYLKHDNYLLSVNNIDLLIIVSFLLIALSIGIYAGRQIKTINDYVKYYKNYSPAILGLSLVMVIFGSGTISGTVSEIVDIGIIYAIASFGYVINSFISAKFIIPKMNNRFDGMISACDIFKYFFDYRAEKFSAIIAIFFDVGAASTQLLALGKMISYFLNIDYAIGLVLTGGIMILYSTLGGIRTVTLMDVIKCALLLIFIPIFASIVTYKAGGFMYVISHTIETKLLVLNHPDFSKYLILFIFFMAPVHMFQPIVVQRLLMINDNKIASKAMYLYGLLRSSLIWMMIAIALSVLILMPDINPKDALFSSIISTLPPIIKGFTIISVIAIVLCKADAHLNSSGIILANNLLPARVKTIFGDLRTIKVCTFMIGLIAISIALADFAVIKVIILIESLWGVCIGLPLIAGILGLKVNSRLFWLYIYSIVPIFILINIFISGYYKPLALLIIGIIEFSLLYYNCIYKNEYTKILGFKKIYFYILHYMRIFIAHLPSLKFLLRYSTKSVEDMGADYYVFGIFFCAIFSFPFFMWDISQPKFTYIILTIRITIALLCLFLLLKDFWPQKLHKYFPIYWHFSLMITLPFMSFLMLLLQKWAIIWLISTCLSILLLVLLTDWLIFTFLTVIGIILALVTYKFIAGSIYFPSETIDIFVIIYTISFSILIGIIFARRKEITNQEKLEVAKLLGGTIAHEMRTVLLTIRNYSKGLNRFLPILTDIYSTASYNKLVTNSIPKEQFNVLKDITANIDTAVKRATSFIDLLLVNIRGYNNTDNNLSCSISECIREALNDFPMNKQTRDCIEVNIAKDFLVYSNKEVIIHILLNLINNSVYYFSSLGRPKIEINTIITDKFNYIHFKDNGPGINKNDINLIFNKFYSKAKKGSGLGLSYCKISMNMLEGDITCESVEGHYTKFILKFPKHS